MVIDSKGRNLLDELEQVDGAVEERGFKFPFEVDLLRPGFDSLNVIGEVDEGSDMDSKLAEYGADDVRIEDVGLRAFFGEAFNGLRDALVGPFSVEKEDSYLCS